MKFYVFVGSCALQYVVNYQELEQIETIWSLTKDWEGHWAEWKTGRFEDLQTRDMEELSNGIYKKLHKLSRELKVRTHAQIKAVMRQQGELVLGLFLGKTKFTVFIYFKFALL